ncbi:MAG: hypothetical protein KKD05_00685 [Candidatus Omnitrophica bacterium]|nr:hypothetical protein [Candidatus Omnitrophota bacterium]
MIKTSLKKISTEVVFGYLFFIITVSAFANGADIEKNPPTPQSYVSSSWQVTMNKPEEKNDKYPEKRKITPETLRVALDEYYVPQISELLSKGVDCFEWVNHLDDPYLNRYKLDLRVDPDDDRVNLFWKRQF